MNYLSYLNIKHFRGIENLELKDLSTINIIVGDNNSGKTSLLEAITLLESPDNIKNMLLNASKRDSNNNSKFELFLEMFPKNQFNERSIHLKSTINNYKNDLKIKGNINEIIDFNNNIELEKKIFEGNIILKQDNENVLNKDIYIEENTKLRLSGSQNIVDMVYVTPYDHFKEGLLNRTIDVIKDGDKKEIVRLLNMFDNNISGFEMLPNTNNSTTIYIEHKKYGLMPLSSFGDGVKKVITLASAIVSCKGGILLIDEIETAIHKNMIGEVFNWFTKACFKYNIQLICTTHSLEVIDAMINNIDDNIDELVCFRIESQDENVYTTRFSGNKLKDIRTLLGQDVR